MGFSISVLVPKNFVQYCLLKMQNPMFNMLNLQMSTHDISLSFCQQTRKCLVYCKDSFKSILAQSNLYVGS